MTYRDEEVVELFFDVTKLNRQQSDKRFGNMSPFRGQYRCLLVLERKGPLTSKELSQELGIKAASVSELIGKMSEKGWIETRTSDKDKRVIVTSLTQVGKEEATSIAKKRATAHADMVSSLTEQEKIAFAQSLEKIKTYYLNGGEEANG